MLKAHKIREDFLMEFRRCYQLKAVICGGLLGVLSLLSISQAHAEYYDNSGLGVGVGVGPVGVGADVGTYDNYGNYYYSQPYYNPGPDVYIGGGYYGGGYAGDRGYYDRGGWDGNRNWQGGDHYDRGYDGNRSGGYSRGFGSRR